MTVDVPALNPAEPVQEPAQEIADAPALNVPAVMLNEPTEKFLPFVVKVAALDIVKAPEVVRVPVEASIVIAAV